MQSSIRHVSTLHLTSKVCTQWLYIYIYFNLSIDLCGHIRIQQINIYIYTSSTRTRRGRSCLKDIYKTFLVYRTCMRLAPAKPVRACTLRNWCRVAHVIFEAPRHIAHLTDFTLHTAPFAINTSLHTVLLRLHTSHFTLHIALFALQTSHFTVHTSHCTLRTPNVTLHSPHFTLLISHCFLHTPNFTLHSSRPTLDTALFTPHTSSHLSSSHLIPCNLQWSSHSNAICNQRFKNRIELRTQTQPLVAKHIGGTIRAQNDPSRTRRTDEVPFIVACSHFTRKNTRFRAPASSPKHIAHATFMQPLQCNLQPQLQEPHRTTRTDTTTRCKTHRRNNSRTKRGTFHRRLQPLYTEKHKVWCSGFLPKT